MPQMFPLLWIFLFFTTAAMLLSMMSMVFFKEKPSPSFFNVNHSGSPKAPWKW